MGTGDLSSPTTDFFDLHKGQCVYYASKLRGIPEAASVVASMDAAVVACDAAIAGGRLRSAMGSVTANMPTIVTQYNGLTKATRDSFDAAVKADAKTPSGG